MICTECNCTIQHGYRGACVTCLRREIRRLWAIIRELVEDDNLIKSREADLEVHP